MANEITSKLFLLIISIDKCFKNGYRNFAFQNFPVSILLNIYRKKGINKNE